MLVNLHETGVIYNKNIWRCGMWRWVCRQVFLNYTQGCVSLELSTPAGKGSSLNTKSMCCQFDHSCLIILCLYVVFLVWKCNTVVFYNIKSHQICRILTVRTWWYYPNCLQVAAGTPHVPDYDIIGVVVALLRNAIIWMTYDFEYVVSFADIIAQQRSKIWNNICKSVDCALLRARVSRVSELFDHWSHEMNWLNPRRWDWKVKAI